jgi:hypothetical protein
MESSPPGSSSRRTLLMQTAIVLGGAVGAAACGQASAAAPSGPASTRSTAGTGNAWTLLGSGRTLAPAPVDGVVDTTAIAFGGVLMDAASGVEVGRFCAQALGRAGFPSGAAGGVEIQSLQLMDGALYAVGPAGGDRTERSYAVLGGTGRFTGARGTCVVREAPGSGARRSLLFDISLA